MQNSIAPIISESSVVRRRPEDWKVILAKSRDNSQGPVVYYQPKDGSVRVVGANQTPRQTRQTRSNSMNHETREYCATCRQPLPRNSNTQTFMPFMDSNYFRLLADAQNDGQLPSLEDHLSTNSFNQGYYERFFVEQKKLGRGYRGSVFLCQHVLDSVPLATYAVKKVAVGDNHEWLVRMLKEVRLLERLRHPNIVEYKHAWLENHKLTTFGPSIPCLFILMERANGGNLEDWIQLEQVQEIQLRNRLPQATLPDTARWTGGIGMGPGGKVRYLTTAQIWKIFLDIVRGLAHLHRNGIIHRDLKPPNLLLQFANPDDPDEIPNVLISDFGECELMDEDVRRRRTGATGTMEFMAPELLLQDSKGQYLNDFDPAADLWSLGVLLYYLCYSSLPWTQIEDVDVLRRDVLGFQSLSFPDEKEWKEFKHLDTSPTPRVPLELKKLMRRLISSNPRLRPSAQEILDQFDHEHATLEELEVLPALHSNRWKWCKNWTLWDTLSAFSMAYVLISLILRFF